MNLLIADDQEINRKVLRTVLAQEGYQITEVGNGTEALNYLDATKEPVVALIDWEMPGIPGPDVCTQARSRSERPLFLILLTVRDEPRDVVAGLGSGAHDYVTKPFDIRELTARVRIGRQIVELEAALHDRVKELEHALAQVKQLSGLLPICTYCKQIRDDKNYWHQVERYIASHSEAKFSHGCCPSCFEIHLRPQVERVTRQTRPSPPH